jgi:hypothetical protein
MEARTTQETARFWIGIIMIAGAVVIVGLAAYAGRITVENAIAALLAAGTGAFSIASGRGQTRTEQMIAERPTPTEPPPPPVPPTA